MDVQCSAARCSNSTTLAAGAAHHACRRQRRLRASSHPGAALYVCRPRPAQIWSPCGALRAIRNAPQARGNCRWSQCPPPGACGVRENGGRDADADRGKPRVCVRRETVKDGGAWSMELVGMCRLLSVTVRSVGARARVDPTWDGGDGVRDGEWRLARQRPRQLGLQQP